MIKSLLILVISLSDPTVTIDSHNYHFVFLSTLEAAKNVKVAEDGKCISDLVLGLIDFLI